MAPKVSILIPTYNRENVLKETIECALAQDYPSFEIVICDNASSDSSWSIISDYAARYPNIKAIRNNENLGAVKNWIECIKNASGEFGKILWSDDLIAKNFLSKTIPLFDSDTGFVYTATEVFEDKVGSGQIFYRLGETGYYDNTVFISGKLGGLDFPSSPGCAVFRLKDLKENLLLDIPVSKNVDLSAKAVGNDLLIFLLTAYKYPKFAFVKDILSYFRVHKSSITISSKKGELMFMYQLAESFFVEKCGVSNTTFKRFNAKLFLSLLPFRGVFGIGKVQDFYVNTEVKAKDIEFTHLVTLILLLMKRKLLKLR